MTKKTGCEHSKNEMCMLASESIGRAIIDERVEMFGCKKLFSKTELEKLQHMKRVDLV